MKRKHHVIPKSRGGDNRKSNLALVERREHQYYHALFENRTPDEIVDYLNRDFWNSNYEVSLRRIR